MLVLGLVLVAVMAVVHVATMNVGRYKVPK